MTTAENFRPKAEGPEGPHGQRQFRRLLEAAPDAMIIVNASGEITLVNSRTERLFGYPRDELVGKSVELLIPERFNGVHSIHRDVFFANPKAREMGAGLEQRGRRKDGAEFPVEISLSPLDTEQGTLAMAAVRDITTRKRTERTLQESETRFSAFFHNSVLPFIITRLSDGVYLEVNDAFTKTLGWTRDEAVGKTGLQLGILPNPGARSDAVEGLAEGGKVAGRELRVKTKEGRDIDVVVSMQRIQSGGQDCVAAAFIDVTEFKAAGAAIRDSEERMRLLIDGARDYAIFMLDPEGRVATWNEGARRIKGYSAAEAVGQYFSIFYTPDDVAAGKPERELREAAATGNYREEGLRVRKDGTVFWAQVNLTALRAPDGRLRGFSKVTQDITARRRLEEELRSNRDLLARAEQGAHYGSFEIDVPTMAIRISDGFKAAFGLPPESDKKLEELTGMVVEEDRQAAMDVTRHALTTVGSTYFKYRLRREDGEVRPFDVSMQTMPAADGTPGRVLGIARDLTEQVKAESRVKESEERFAAFFQNSLLPFAITRLADGMYLEINNAFTRTLGYTREDVLGRTPQVIGILSDAATRARAVEGVATEGHVEAKEVQLRAKDGRLVDAVVSMTRIRSAGQDCIAAGFVDVTARKKAEVELERSAADLKAANADLEAFTYSVSHDLRAPLRSMAGFARILRDEHGAQLDSAGRHDVDTIVDSAQEMGQLIDDLLAFSRLGKHPMRLEEVSPRGIVDRLVNDMRPSLNDRKVDFVVGDLPACRADATLLKQVFVNLLSNASKYSRRRDVASIEIGWTPDEGGTYFVKDNGVGFDQQYAANLFGVFQRLHRAEDYEGTGVGLAIVRRIVTRHGGRVWAEAAIDQGATFYFTLQGGLAA